MTTPDERRRNLIWGRETLEEFSRDASLSDPWRGEVVQRLAGYPSLAFLQQYDARDTADLSPMPPCAPTRDGCSSA